LGDKKLLKGERMESTVLQTVEQIGKIISILLSLVTIIWSLVSVVKNFVEKLKIAINQQDWETTIELINEFVKAAEQQFAAQDKAGAEKKALVISLLEKAGYEVTEIIDALIESAVYSNFNEEKQ